MNVGASDALNDGLAPHKVPLDALGLPRRRCAAEEIAARGGEGLPVNNIMHKEVTVGCRACRRAGRA